MFERNPIWQKLQSEPCYQEELNPNQGNQINIDEKDFKKDLPT